MKETTGAVAIVDALKRGGVRCVFGVPGTQTVELFEALRSNGLRTVLSTTELGAAFAAGGWARVTGETGVLITIPGPGFTWALTGVAEARLDSVPLLHITGTVGDSNVTRRFRQQELAQATIAGPIVKAVIDADESGGPAQAVQRALHVARSGEPGPVLLEVSPQTLTRKFRGDSGTAWPPSASNLPDFSALRAKLTASRRPIFFVGQGTLEYADALREMVEGLGAPLLTTLSGRGVIQESHPLCLGFDPVSGSLDDVNALLDSADLIVALGCKLSHNGTCGFKLRFPSNLLVHVDASADVIGANYPVALGIVADVGEALNAVQDPPLTPSGWNASEVAAWRKRTTTRVQGSLEPDVGGSSAGDARTFFEKLREVLPTDAILVVDSGLHQILARRYYEVLSPRGLLIPGDFQSMGFAIPTAIGARLARPERPVVALVGDGGFAMTALELLSAIREGIALVVIVFSDGALSQIRLQQLEAYGVGHAVTLASPDYALFAKSLGARHAAVGNNVAAVVRAALEYRGITILEVPVGDSLAIRRIATVARARETVRKMAGPRLFNRVRQILRGRKF